MRFLILGAGLSGLGAARLMKQQGHDVTLVNRGPFDSSSLEDMGITCIFNDDASLNDGSYDVFIKAPGIVDSHPLVQTFDVITNEIEWAARYSPHSNYYCISGTNGKTTATTLLHQILLKKDEAALLAGNVGIALSQKVYDDGDVTRDVALEISGFQMDGLLEFKPEVYGLLNLSPDHLDHYVTEEAYYQSKLQMIPAATTFIRNIDDANIIKYTEKTNHTLDLSLKTKADIYLNDGVIYFEDVALFPVDVLKIKGEHNLYNASLAAAIAYLAGVSPKLIEEAISEFKAVEHRNEYVDTINGISYYNDSKATNPESVLVCLNSFEKPVLLLAGGYDKHISFDILNTVKDKVSHAFLFGDSAVYLKEIFPNHTLVEDMQAAFNLAVSQASEGDVILLSPACASYDQFENFEDRGNRFKSFVQNLKI